LRRQRQGYNKAEAQKIIRRRNYFGSMMVDMGDADAMIGTYVDVHEVKEMRKTMQGPVIFWHSWDFVIKA
jgi:malate dehydrogenase (oxaloacetate-decarboxylating)(NADP+)